MSAIMDGERWQEVRAHFEAVVDRPPEGRAAYLDNVGKQDEALRRAVEILLASDAQADTFLEQPPQIDLVSETDSGGEEADPGAWGVGRSVGAYRLTALLGQGGMGAVYAAERADDQFEQRVAIKLVRWDADTPDLRRRFHMERQILASLQHPNIARLLDGGVTRDGIPYLVMEYVEGRPLHEYCTARSLALDARLELFRTVCAAVQYAHQNLVVHRDLKPTNILVTEDGTVKLLDFGIAKLLDVGAAADLSAMPKTRAGMQVLTPEYAAPEQIRGEAITTATDVYQLGVLLYQLLTGQLPYWVRGLMPSEVERIICTEQPTKPSVATRQINAATPQPTTGPSTNTKSQGEDGGVGPSRLKGDLDTIVLKALRKEPERRYGSPEQFAEDIRRHLNKLPVSARADAFGYRAGKFMQRHRTGVVAALLVVLSLVGGMTIAFWQAQVAEQQRQRAEQRLSDVRQLAGSFLFEFHDAIADLPGSTAARELVVQRALEYLDRLSREALADPALRVELATAYRKVGDVQGNPTNANLGRTQDALDSYRKGLDLAQSALQQDSTIEARRVLANLYEKLGDVQAASGNVTAAETSKRRAVRAYRRLALEQPEEGPRQVSYAVALIKLGDVLGNPNFTNQGQTDEALQQYLAAEVILERLYTADSSASNTMRLFGLIYERIGTMHDVEGKREAALQAYRRSLALRRRYANAHPTNTDAVRDWAIANEKMGDMGVQMGDLEAARTRYRQSREIFARLAESDPQNVQAQQSLAISHIHLGDLASHATRPSFGDRETARAHFETARALLEDLRSDEVTNSRTQSLLELVNDRLAQW